MGERKNSRGGSAKDSKRSAAEPKPKASKVSGERFQDRVLSMLEWLADKDPVRAAKLIGEYLDDLAAELGNGTPAAKATK